MSWECKYISLILSLILSLIVRGGGCFNQQTNVDVLDVPLSFFFITFSADSPIHSHFFHFWRFFSAAWKPEALLLLFEQAGCVCVEGARWQQRGQTRVRVAFAQQPTRFCCYCCPSRLLLLPGGTPTVSSCRNTVVENVVGFSEVYNFGLPPLCTIYVAPSLQPVP